ncbi:MAG: SAM-dependent DNA methyltransferase [Chloroflexi bacterium]|nr:SAM-dependent DNA methyltransferase [Chloroflexota bacterium]
MLDDYRLSRPLKELETASAGLNEATLRGDFVEAINRFLESKQLRERGVRVASEYRLVRGIPDARVGAIVFEVKLPPPGGAGIEDAVTQCRRYVLEFPASHDGKPARGVAYDGRELALLAEDGSVLHRGPAAAAAPRLEAWLVSLAGAVISPEDFVDRLGPASEVAGQMVAELWKAFTSFRVAVGIIDEAFVVWRGLYSTATNVSSEARANLRRSAASLGITIRENESDTEQYLFIIETYLSLLLRLLLTRVAVQTRLTPYASVTDVLKKSGHPVLALREMQHYVPGVVGVFEEDVFLWPVEAAAHSGSAEASLSPALLDIADGVDDVDLLGASEDFLRLVYQRFFDPVTRRALGEFYTRPDVVDEALDAVEYRGDPDKRLADITCGSGTFLMRAIARARRGGRTSESLSLITRNIIGVDIHPFAVAMARVNYILAIADLVSPDSRVEIPVYWADSLLRLAPTLTRMPGARSGRARGALSAPGARPVIKVAIAGLGEFVLPDHRDVDWNGLLNRVGQTLSLFRPPIDPEAVKARFWEGVSARNYLAYETTINSFLAGIAERHNRRRDMRWLPLLRNALSLDGLRQSCDFVVGNPPWVRIHNIAPEIRARLFSEYQVCVDAGWKRGAALGGIGRGFGRQVDYSIAFVERGREFLKPNGRLSFVITSKVIHALYGNALRKSLVKDTRILALHDYSLHARTLFEDATNYPLILAFEQGQAPASHEVQVTVAGPSASFKSWQTQQKDLPILSPALETGPLNQTEESPWALAPPEVREAILLMQTARRTSANGAPRARRLLGEIPGFNAMMGVKTSLNDVFVVKRVEATENAGEAIVYAEGYYDARLPESDRAGFRARIERELLRPLIRGENIHAWGYEVRDHLIWTHDDVTGEPRRELPPRAREYFSRHEAALRRRSDYRDGMPIWQIFRVSPEKLGHKVVWQRISDDLGCVYLPAGRGRRLTVALDTAYLIPVPDRATGECLAGFLSASAVRLFCLSFSRRDRGAYRHFDSWVLGLVPVPEALLALMTQPNDPVPAELAPLFEISRRLHGSPAGKKLRDLEAELDRTVAGLYGLSPMHVRAIDDYLSFIRPTSPAGEPIDCEKDEAGDEE